MQIDPLQPLSLLGTSIPLVSTKKISLRKRGEIFTSRIDVRVGAARVKPLWSMISNILYKSKQGDTCQSWF